MQKEIPRYLNDLVLFGIIVFLHELTHVFFIILFGGEVLGIRVLCFHTGSHGGSWNPLDCLGLVAPAGLGKMSLIERAIIDLSPLIWPIIFWKIFERKTMLLILPLSKFDVLSSIALL